MWYAQVPLSLERGFSKLADMVGFALLPYWFAQSSPYKSPTTGTIGAREVGHLQVNVTFPPREDEAEEVDGLRTINLTWSLNNQPAETYDRVDLPPLFHYPLPSTSIAQAARVAYETDAVRKCFR